MKLKNSSGEVNQRRIRVLAALEQQLKDALKPDKNSPILDGGKFGITHVAFVDLTEHDKERIKKEIEVLKKKIVHDDSARAVRTKKYRGPK